MTAAEVLGAAQKQKMKSRSIKLITVFTLSLNAVFYSQIPETIRVKREKSFMYFFQKGNKSDTISKSKSNLFYLIVPDSLKEFISVQSENGQLLATANDSIIKFNFVKGIKYELIFEKAQTGQSLSPSRSARENKKNYNFKTLINGAVENPQNTIIIKIIDKRQNRLLLENRFFYKE